MRIGKHLPVVLLLSVSDPSGTMGIQAGISVLSSMEQKTFVSAIVTAHIVRRDGSIFFKSVPPEVLRSQLREALANLRPDVVKIGFLPDPASVCEVVAALRSARVRKIIYNPRFKDENGHRLLSTDTVKAICCHLLPIVRLLIVERVDSEILLQEKRGNSLPVKQMTDVQISRCLISTFHCFCYLSVPEKYDILSVEKEVFYYRSIGELMTAVSVAGKCKNLSKVEAKHAVMEEYSTAVAGYWSTSESVKIPLYNAKKYIKETIQRHSYLNENHTDAPYYPLTEGGNYE